MHVTKGCATSNTSALIAAIRCNYFDFENEKAAMFEPPNGSERFVRTTKTPIVVCSRARRGAPISAQCMFLFSLSVAA
jgi:hypothetical protein